MFDMVTMRLFCTKFDKSAFLKTCKPSSNVAMAKIRPPPWQMPNMMDIGSRSIFNENHDIFQQSVRRFAHEEWAPKMEEFEKEGKPSKEIWRKLGEQGLLGVSTPTELGGIGGTYNDETIVLEEQCYAQAYAPCVAVHSGIIMPYFANYGTQEQRNKYMPGLQSGDQIAAIGMSEPDAGSDLQGIRTHAKRDGNDFIINGSKTFITNGILANTFIIVTVTDFNAKSIAHGLTLFIMEDNMPGFKRGRNLKKLGFKGQDTAELFFEDVRVPKENILGTENQGFFHLMAELPQERIGVGILAMANAEWMFEITREYINNRKAFGQTISALQTVQHKMAEIKTSIAVCRAFLDECIQQHDQKTLSNESASMAKYWATDLENKVAAECLQLHGGMGYMWESPIARAFANARLQTIYGGSNEIMKELIARSICKK